MDIKTERNEFTQVQNIETAFPNKTELIYKVVRTKDFSIDSSHNQVYFLIRQNDGREDSGKFCDVHGNDHERQDNVPQCHERNNDAAYACDALNAAENNGESEHGEHGSHVGGRNGESFLKGLADGVALH